jgi:hypothetical protein
VELDAVAIELDLMEPALPLGAFSMEVARAGSMNPGRVPSRLSQVVSYAGTPCSQSLLRWLVDGSTVQFAPFGVGDQDRVSLVSQLRANLAHSARQLVRYVGGHDVVSKNLAAVVFSVLWLTRSKW